MLELVATHMDEQPQIDRDWKAEAEAWRARAEQLQSTVDRLRSMAAAGEAAGFLAHELNNLFTPVVGYCHAAQCEGADDSVKSKALRKALAAAERVGEVSHAILSLAGSAVEHADNGPADVAGCVESALIVAGTEAWGRDGVRVKVDVPRGIEAMASAGVLQQVVLNLLLNARRAMKGRSGRIGVWAREVGETVRMEVRDEGAGMSREVLARVFGITSIDDLEQGDHFKVDVNELAQSGSINGQAGWGVRLHDMARGPMGKGPQEGVGGSEKIERLRGARVAASMSPIRVWDAGEVAREMRAGQEGNARGVAGPDQTGERLRQLSVRTDIGSTSHVGRGGDGADRGLGPIVERARGGHDSIHASTRVVADAGETRGADRRESGSGLGVALCLELVGRAGGKMRVRSTVGEGTAVVVEWARPARAKRAA